MFPESVHTYVNCANLGTLMVTNINTSYKYSPYCYEAEVQSLFKGKKL